MSLAQPAAESDYVPHRREFRFMRMLAFDVLLVLVTLVILFPFLMAVITALKSTSDIIQNPLGLPSSWEWGNFTRAWSEGHFGRYFWNSVLVVVPTVLGVIGCSLLAAFAFATTKFRGSTLLFALFMVGLTIPLDILIIPLFYEMLSLGLLDTLPALILPQIAIGLPFGILLLRSFIQDLPRELFEASALDGCSRFQMLRHIVYPLTRPAIAALLVFNFMWTWNQFLLPTVLIQSDERRTLPVGLNYFQGRYISDVSLLLAGATIAFIPVIVVYVIFQRQIIRGMTVGVTK
jgi:raffinose/stachyose/melibiose transport system permease protein